MILSGSTSSNISRSKIWQLKSSAHISVIASPIVTVISLDILIKAKPKIATGIAIHPRAGVLRLISKPIIGTNAT